MRHVVDAVAHDQADRALAGLHERPEGLAAEIGRKRAPVRGAVDLAALVLDRRTDGDELGHVRAPLITSDLEADPDDAVSTKLIGLLLHPRHRKLARRVHGLCEDAHLLAGLPARLLKSDVIDARAHD